MATGNGAHVIHSQLQDAIPDYSLRSYNPYWSLFPPSLFAFRGRGADIIHTTPDYAPFFAHKKTPLVLTFHNYILDDYMKRYSSCMQRLHYASDLKWFTKTGLSLAMIVTSVSNFTANIVSTSMMARISK